MDSNSEDVNRRRKCRQYSLRPRSLKHYCKKDLFNADIRADIRIKNNATLKKHRSKSRTQPLSKYRRKTANARERQRLKEINDAFEVLRRTLPTSHNKHMPGLENTVTKITTLKSAVDYIRNLSKILEECEDFENSTIISQDQYSSNCSSALYQTVFNDEIEDIRLDDTYSSSLHSLFDDCYYMVDSCSSSSSSLQSYQSLLDEDSIPNCFIQDIEDSWKKLRTSNDDKDITQILKPDPSNNLFKSDYDPFLNSFS